MRIFLAVLLALQLAAVEPADPFTKRPPQLLLSVKLLRRLKRDRERQTIRWVNFENRVKNVPNSPERGFELALYFAITNDQEAGRQAINWANLHPCEFPRQRMLIADWVGDLPPADCPGQLPRQPTSDPLEPFKNGMPSPENLYSFVEDLSIERAKTGKDIRSAAPQFFRDLPIEYLLSLKPDQVEHPTWMTHIAALALVSIDPNLQASQFLQGWALEDNHILRDGPGVAYELLWADPYLPGIAYQNLDPWIYNSDGGRLFARSDWTSNACWIAISKANVQEVNCPAGWRDKPVHFGSMTLLPMTTKCMQLPHQEPHENIVVWRLPPGQNIGYLGLGEKKESTAPADNSGLWHPGANIEGRVCRR